MTHGTTHMVLYMTSQYTASAHMTHATPHMTHATTHIARGTATRHTPGSHTHLLVSGVERRSDGTCTRCCQEGDAVVHLAHARGVGDVKGGLTPHTSLPR